MPRARGLIRRKEHGSYLARYNGSQLFVARQNPDRQRASSANIHVQVETTIDIHQGKLDQEHRSSSVDGLLTRYVGIEENLHIPSEDYTRPPFRANISHARIIASRSKPD